MPQSLQKPARHPRQESNRQLTSVVLARAAIQESREQPQAAPLRPTIRDLRADTSTTDTAKETVHQDEADSQHPSQQRMVQAELDISKTITRVKERRHRRQSHVAVRRLLQGSRRTLAKQQPQSRKQGSPAHEVRKIATA